jgi:hypothetical protein
MHQPEAVRYLLITKTKRKYEYDAVIWRDWTGLGLAVRRKRSPTVSPPEFDLLGEQDGCLVLQNGVTYVQELLNPALGIPSRVDNKNRNLERLLRDKQTECTELCKVTKVFVRRRFYTKNGA